MGRLMRLCATKDWPDCPITTRIFAWKGDISPRSQSVPLRVASALHALRLKGHVALAAVYPPNEVDDETLWSAVSTTLMTETDFIDDWIDSPPQTNEVRRSVTLIPVGHVLAHRYGLPIRMSELGASGGLNLHWDAYALQTGGRQFGATDPALVLTPDWNGQLPPETRPTVVERAGVDLTPLDPAKDALRLQSYLWPDQPQRLALTGAAIAVTRTKVDKGDAIDWLEPRLTHQAGQLHLIYSTVAWQYFPAAKQEEGTKMIEAAGRSATEQSPLAWFAMENDGGKRGAALTLRLWPGDLTLDLGRADFHGRWVDWSG